MQLRCRCVRGRVAEKLHELQCVHRVNSGWNGEKLMVGDRRRGCHTLFFFLFRWSEQGCTKCAPRAYRTAATLPMSKHFIVEPHEIGQSSDFACEERRGRIERDFPSRCCAFNIFPWCAFNFILFERKLSGLSRLYHVIKF